MNEAQEGRRPEKEIVQKIEITQEDLSREGFSPESIGKMVLEKMGFKLRKVKGLMAGHELTEIVDPCGKVVKGDWKEPEKKFPTTNPDNCPED